MLAVPDYGQFLESFGSTKFRALWPVQSQVLAAYQAQHVSTPDIAIDLPTGSGKSLIALLIAEAWRRDGKKVAILSANKTLARQLQQEAEALGIPRVLMEGKGGDILPQDKRAYQRAQRVGIMNYWFYFNQNPAIDPADLLIMDDAHLAEHCLHSLYSVEITRSDHETLFKTLIDELVGRYPEYRVLADAVAGDDASNTPPELFSFIDQLEVSTRIREIVDASPHIEESDLGFRWRRLRHLLGEANIYLGVNSIWIRPYIWCSCRVWWIIPPASSVWFRGQFGPQCATPLAQKGRSTRAASLKGTGCRSYLWQRPQLGALIQPHQAAAPPLARAYSSDVPSTWFSRVSSWRPATK
jgi:hypothetical protein